MPDQARELVEVHAAPRECDEHEALPGIVGQAGAGLAQVPVDPAQGPLADRDEAVLVALALAHQQHAPLAVEIAQLQANASARRSPVLCNVSSTARFRRPTGVARSGSSRTVSTSRTDSACRGSRFSWRSNRIS